MAKDAWIQIRVEKAKREEIKKEAEKRGVSVSQLMLEGYETLKEGKYIDFKQIMEIVGKITRTEGKLFRSRCRYYCNIQNDNCFSKFHNLLFYRGGSNQALLMDKWDKAHMEAAEVYGSLSHAKRLKVGCVIVRDNRIISIGYNGTPSGWDNNCEIRKKNHTMQNFSFYCFRSFMF